MSQSTYIFQLFSLPTEMYKTLIDAFASICRCVCNLLAERTNSSPVSSKLCIKLYLLNMFGLLGRIDIEIVT